jgi:hypothetical protein
MTNHREQDTGILDAFASFDNPCIATDYSQTKSVPATRRGRFQSVLPWAGVLATCALSSGAAAQFNNLSIMYNWETRPDVADNYEFLNTPQPVCASDKGVPKVYIISNYDFYASLPGTINNTDTHVAVIDGGGAYAMLPTTLPGKKWEFSLAAVPGGLVYLFGGRDGTGEYADVYTYEPGGSFNTTAVAQIPAYGTVAGNRSGVAASFVGGKIYLFGGRHAGAALKQVLEFDPASNSFTLLPPMPVALYGARIMAKAAPAGKVYLYLAGGRASGGAIDYRILRFDTSTKVTDIVRNKAVNGVVTDVSLPAAPAAPAITWDPGGTIRIIAAGAFANGNWGNMQAWALTDDPPNMKASLAAAPYSVPLRARDQIGVAKCDSFTYIVGGTYGHPSNALARARMVDRLAPLTAFFRRF